MLSTCDGCEPCRDEYPMLNGLAKLGLVVIGVSLDDDTDINLVRRFPARTSPVFSNFRKKPGKDEESINAVHLRWSGALPATFFYEGNGRLTPTLVGEHKRHEFERIIRQMLRTPAPAAAGAARRSAP